MFRRILIAAALTAAPILSVAAATAAQSAAPSAIHTVHPQFCSVYAAADTC